MIELKETLERLQKAERRIAEERGDFVMFALLHRKDGLWDIWDVVFSAPWVDEIRPWQAYEIMDRELKKDLLIEDFHRFARYVVVPTDSDWIEEFAESYTVEHGRKMFRNREFLERDIRQGFIFTCRAPLKKVA